MRPPPSPEIPKLKSVPWAAPENSLRVRPPAARNRGPSLTRGGAAAAGERGVTEGRAVLSKVRQPNELCQRSWPKRQTRCQAVGGQLWAPGVQSAE